MICPRSFQDEANCIVLNRLKSVWNLEDTEGIVGGGHYKIQQSSCERMKVETRVLVA